MAVIRPGQVAILRLPNTDLSLGKSRPVLLIARVPGVHDDWLVCMLSTQLQHVSEGFDELIDQSQRDFQSSGLKIASVVRIARLAVVAANLLVGTIGEVGPDRLKRVQGKLANWIQGL
jgi:mRNA interferase MazF